MWPNLQLSCEFCEISKNTPGGCFWIVFFLPTVWNSNDSVLRNIISVNLVKNEVMEEYKPYFTEKIDFFDVSSKEIFQLPQ